MRQVTMQIGGSPTAPGTIWANAYRTVNWTMPFGGVKASGFGRENGTEGLHGYLQDKAVWIETTGDTRDPFVLG